MAGRSPYRRRTAPRRSSRGGGGASGAGNSAAAAGGGLPSAAAPTPGGGGLASDPDGVTAGISTAGAADSLASIAGGANGASAGAGLTSPSAYADAAAASIGAPGTVAGAGRGGRLSYESAGGAATGAAGMGGGGASSMAGAGTAGGGAGGGGVGASFLSDGPSSSMMAAGATGGAASARRSYGGAGGGGAGAPTYGGGLVPGASPAFSTATGNTLGSTGNAAGGVLGTAIPNANASIGRGVGGAGTSTSVPNGSHHHDLSYSSYSTAHDGTTAHDGGGFSAVAIASGQDATSTHHLRTLLLSTLQHVIPPSPLNCPTASSVTNAVFFGSLLYARTKHVGDAYLYARALALNGEGKRAVWMLEGAGLLGHPRPTVTPDDGDNGSGGGNGIDHKASASSSPALRVEAALLAAECMIAAGEWDDALNVMEVVSCYPPPGHRQASQQQQQQSSSSSATSGDGNGTGGGNGQGKDAEEVDYFGLDAHLVFHQIEDGDDARLDLLADLIRPPAGSVGDDVPPALINAVHPISRLAVLLGIVHDEFGNPTRSATFLRAALRIDPRNVQALDHCLHRRIMDKDQERSMILNLSFDGVPGGEFLRDVYLAKLGFAPADAAIVGYEPNENDVAANGDCDGQNDKMDQDQDETVQPATNGNKDTTLSSPNVILQQQTPNLTFMGGHAMDESSIQLEESQMMSPAQLKAVEEQGEDDRKPAAAANTPAADARVPLTPSDEINRSLVRLTSHPDLSSSSEILSLAAIHAYAKYDLPLTLSYCQLLEKADPYCQNAAYVHISALASLGYKRPLFQLAHRLVDSSPKAAKSWYAVGSYYYACGRYDLAQRHFCRAARLDPRSSECWIAFGCSFAACDESDQALASYRAASRLNPGDHYPLLYMGMEYVRTNHLSLASHFLKSAWRVSGNTDPLVRSEMGVLHYRKGEWDDAVTCFVHAVRLVAEMTLDREGEGDETGVGSSTLMNTGANEMEVDNDAENTPHGRGRPSIGNPPMTSVRFAKDAAAADVSTFSHHAPCSHNAPHHPRSKSKSKLSDIECIQLCRDAYWEPTIFNLGQSYRKICMFDEAAACFEKSLSICPGKASSYSALGFTRHLNGDLDGAIEAYHQSLSRKPDDPFCSEMLMRALNESLHYPQSNPIFDDEVDASQDESFLSAAGNGSASGFALSPRGRASSAAASASFLSGHYSESRMSASASNFTFDSGTDVEMG